jgi:hypothetical protein
MGLFEFLMILVSVVIGLGLTETLSGLGRLLRSRETVRFHWLQRSWWILIGVRESLVGGSTGTTPAAGWGRRLGMRRPLSFLFTFLWPDPCPRVLDGLTLCLQVPTGPIGSPSVPDGPIRRVVGNPTVEGGIGLVGQGVCSTFPDHPGEGRIGEAPGAPGDVDRRRP